MKWIKTFLLFALFFTGCSRSKKIEPASPKTGFFFTVPIDSYAYGNMPCVQAKIDGKNCCLGLDLGFNCSLVLTKELFEKVQNKTFLHKGTLYGIKGKNYEFERFLIPEIEIGDLIFSNVSLQEQSEEFKKDARLGTVTPKQIESGTLGWPLFGRSNLLIDAKKNLLAFSDSWESLEKHDYKRENFISAPLILERGALEFEVDNHLCCLLDSGSTWNILNEINQDLGINSISIQGKDLGKVDLIHLPIPLPFRVDVILGMDFIQNHTIFIDFSKEKIYISR